MVFFFMSQNPNRNIAAQRSASDAGGGANTTLAGIALLVAAVACFACMDTTVKWLSASLPSLQIVSIRYIGSFLLTLALLRPAPGAPLLKAKRPGLQILRSLGIVLTTVCSFTALQYIPLTEVTSVTFSSPLIVAVIAWPLLGEKMGPRRVVAVLVGFAGVIVITRPGSHGVHPAIALAVLAAITNALYAVATRMLAAHDSPKTTIFYTGLCGTVIMLPILPFAWQTPTTIGTWLGLLVTGVFGALGHWLLILAHQRATATVLAPFFYAQLVFAMGLAMLFLGERPDVWTFVGASIVMGSGLYLIYRERVRKVPVPSADMPA
ncbi:drug/metabolite transporter (DMT)-like permease [Ereboglobus sp. PH5-5]|nr:drug/metabolite transporter (DMT)-like permease [Ereboglobus sp. PH5-5]